MAKTILQAPLMAIALALFLPSTLLAKGISQMGKHRPVLFIENKGQVTDQSRNQRPDIDFKVAASSGLNVFIGGGALHYQWSKTGQGHHIEMYRMDVELVGANLDAPVLTQEKSTYFQRYYLAQTGKAGAKAGAFRKITYKDIYPAIDWVLYLDENGKLEYDFVVRPGGKVSDIRIRYGGASRLALDAAGNLIATTPVGKIIEQAPYSFEQNSNGKVRSGFKLDGDTVSFLTGEYTGTLVIDPAVEWATYFGGLSRDWGKAVATDEDGNIFMTGDTESTDDIATTGSYQTTYAGGVGDWGYPGDAFIAKFNAEGELLWATYFGGDNDEGSIGIATDAEGNVFASGWTLSATGIATSGAHQEVIAGEDDAYLAKFNADGELQWATYFGGEMNDNLFGGGSIFSDAAGNVYLSGTTMSETGIATDDAWQAAFGGTFDAFLAKFDNDGDLIWSTYFGGVDEDRGRFVTGAGDSVIYVAGFTNGSTGIATDGAYQEGYGGGTYDAFLARFNADGTLSWATYLGGSDYDKAEAAVCAGEYVYLSGATLSSSSIATSGSYQETQAGAEDVFVAQFNHSGALNWSTYYGGSANDRTAPSGSMAADALGNLYLTGQTGSSEGIATADAIQPDFAGTFDAFIAKFSTVGDLQWGSYYGGTGDDFGYGLMTNGSGMLYLAGTTSSGTGIASEESYMEEPGGGDDGFLLAVNDCVTPDMPAAISGADFVCSASEQIYTIGVVEGAISYSWTLPEGWTGTSDETSITVTTGSIGGEVIVTANGLCADSEPQTLTVTVSPIPVLSPANDTAICFGSSLDIFASIEGADIVYRWQKDGETITGEMSSLLTLMDAGTYRVLTDNAACVDTSAPITIAINPLPEPMIVNTDGVLSTTESYSSYQWNYEGEPITGATTASYATPVPGAYSVTVTDMNGCSATSDNITGLDDPDVSGQINLYPNPFTGSIAIQSPVHGMIRLYSLDGRLMLADILLKPGTTNVDLTGLSSGIYWLKLTSDKGSMILYRKVVKSN